MFVHQEKSGIGIINEETRRIDIPRDQVSFRYDTDIEGIAFVGEGAHIQGDDWNKARFVFAVGVGWYEWYGIGKSVLVCPFVADNSGDVVEIVVR